MAVPLRRTCAAVTSVALAAAALLAAGCGPEEGVHSYTVPRESEAKAAATEYRLLGAMFPASEPVWFFKFSGPDDQITQYAADFDKLLASVKIAGGKPDFTPPPGWTRGPGRGGVVVETVRPPDGKLEVTVTQSAGGVAQNLNRWVGQIGLKPKPTDEADYTRTIDAAGVKGVRVDLRGPKNPATSRGMIGMH